MAVHWTKKPENREKLRAIQAASVAARRARAKKTKHGPQTARARRRLSLSMKAAHARKKKNGLPWKAAALEAPKASAKYLAALAKRDILGPFVSNGAGPARAALVPLSGKRLAKESVRALALDGARARLAAIEQERELLLVFLKAGQ